MKRLDEIKTYSIQAESEFSPQLSKKDSLVQQLESDGHRVIPINRAFLVIEQCDKDDHFPKGWTQDPLKISVYPDTDVGSETPNVLYIHAGRFGLHEVILDNGEWVRYADFEDLPNESPDSVENLKRMMLALNDRWDPKVRVQRVMDSLHSTPFDGTYIKTSSEKKPFEIDKERVIKPFDPNSLPKIEVNNDPVLLEHSDKVRDGLKAILLRLNELEL